MNRRVLANLVFFLGLFGLLVFWALNNIISFDRIERPFSVSAELPAASGLLPNAEVAYMGVHAGTVTGVSRTPTGVKVEMKLDRGTKIPSEATGHVFRKSAIGEPYVDFFPPGRNQGFETPEGDTPLTFPSYLKAGDNVPMSRMFIPLEFSDFLKTASELVGNVDPDDLQTLIHELAVGLQGRSDSLRQLTQAGDELSATFAARSDLLDRLTRNNTRLTKTLADHRTSLGSAFTNLQQVGDALQESRTDLVTLLDQGPEFAGQTADIIDSQLNNLDCLLGNLEVVGDHTTTPAHLDALRVLLQVGPEGFAATDMATDKRHASGPWARVNLLTETQNPSVQYIPERTLPAVRPIPGCVSSLSSSGVDFVPTGTGGTATGALAATGRSLAVTLALALVAAALVLRAASAQPDPDDA